MELIKKMKTLLLVIVVSILTLSCSENVKKEIDKKKVYTDSIQIINLDSCFLELMLLDSVIDMNNFCIEYDSVEFISPYILKEKIEAKINKTLEVDWSEVPEQQYVLIFYHDKKRVGIVSRDIIDFSSNMKNRVFKSKRFLLKIRNDNVSTKVVVKSIGSENLTDF